MILATPLRSAHVLHLAVAWSLGEPLSADSFADRWPELIVGGTAGDLIQVERPGARVQAGGGLDLLVGVVGGVDLCLGEQGGLAWLLSAGTTLYQYSGVSVVFGSSGSDDVHIFGGVNLVILGAGDDRVFEHGRNTSVILGGPGHDARCWESEADRSAWMLLDVEAQGRCPDDSLLTSTVVAVPTKRETVLEADGEVLNNPPPSSSGNPIREYTLEVWAVLSGGDPGLVGKAYQPGGLFRWKNGSNVSTSIAWGREAEVGTLRVFHLYRESTGARWIFKRPAGGEEIGESVLDALSRP